MDLENDTKGTYLDTLSVLIISHVKDPLDSTGCIGWKNEFEYITVLSVEQWFLLANCYVSPQNFCPIRQTKNIHLSLSVPARSADIDVSLEASSSDGLLRRRLEAFLPPSPILCASLQSPSFSSPSSFPEPYPSSSSSLPCDVWIPSATSLVGTGCQKEFRSPLHPLDLNIFICSH